MKPLPVEPCGPRARWSAAHRAALCVLLAFLTLGAGQAQLPPAAQVAEVRKYIKTSWSTLSRSNRDLPAAAKDPKLHRPPGTPWPVYVSRREDRARVAGSVKEVLDQKEFGTIDLKTLPANLASIEEHGLLYLPRPYVVPGGRFNEMYGWDSYFIQVGLLEDGELALARDMVDNFIYEIDHYGTILNANRTYFLTRSQPPFLTRMILGVYGKSPDRAWLQSTLPAIESSYRFWTTGQHAVPETGLSRYWDSGRGAGARSSQRREGRAGTDALRSRARILPHDQGHRL